MWRKWVESSEESFEREVRHKEYVQLDLVLAIHAVHAMVGVYEGSCQIGNLVLLLSSCGFIAKSSHHVGAFLTWVYFHRL